MPRELRIGSSKRHWPFSRGLVVETLLTAGASKKSALAVARQVEAQLRVSSKASGKANSKASGKGDKNKHKVTSTSALKKLVIKLARPVVGAEMAASLRTQRAAFEELSVLSERGPLPFSRGVLIRSLEDSGIAPRSAYTVAHTIERELRVAGVAQIESEELGARIEQLLPQLADDQALSNYRFLRHNRGYLGVSGSQQEPPAPFSKGILSQSLLASGVTPEAAHRLARLIERRLRSAEDRIVKRREIRELTVALLEEEMGPDTALRYQLLQIIRHPPRPIIVLLGGVSGTGKSHLAAEIAYRLGITRIIGTDSIREVMRSMVSPALVPTLHASTFNAWEALIPPDETVPEKPTLPQLVAGFREQVQQVSVGLDAVVRRTIEENASLVLEGVHLVPGYLGARGQAIIVPLLVTLPSAQEHHRHFEMRDASTARARPMHRYLRYFEEIRAMQGELEKLAHKQNVAMLDSVSLDDSVERAVEEVMRVVYSELSSAERQQLLGHDDLGLLDMLQRH